MTLLELLSSWFAGKRQPSWKSDGNAGMSVSPDGRYIAFVGNGKGSSDLYLLDQITSKVERLTNSEEHERNVLFSPTGRFLAYTAGGSSATSPRSVYIRSIDGKFVRRLTNAGTSRIDTYPAFSNDETMIVFAGSAAPGYKYDDLFIVNIHTGKERQLTHYGFNSAPQPRFYDNDRSILFASYRSPEDMLHKPMPPMVISRVGVNGGDWHQEIKLGRVTFNPCPTPKSKSLVLVSDLIKDFYHDIYYLDNLKAKPRSLNVVDLGSSPCCLSYIPSQHAVYFLLNYLEIWRVDLDGKHAIKIADSALFEDPMHWKR